MNTCSLTQSAAAAQQQMHAQASSANHTFYPWMAIAGKATTSTTDPMYHAQTDKSPVTTSVGGRTVGRAITFVIICRSFHLSS